MPLWGRQIPYTMMKFACFERTVEILYKYVVPKPRDQCTKGEQLIVTFAAGYIAGIFCAIVSHPGKIISYNTRQIRLINRLFFNRIADTIVSKLNNEKGLTAGEAARRIGFAGLWKGLVPRIIMIGTLTAFQWFIYDTVKVVLDLPRLPPPSPPKSLQEKLAAQGHK